MGPAKSRLQWNPLNNNMSSGTASREWDNFGSSRQFSATQTTLFSILHSKDLLSAALDAAEVVHLNTGLSRHGATDVQLLHACDLPLWQQERHEEEAHLVPALGDGISVAQSRRPPHVTDDALLLMTSVFRFSLRLYDNDDAWHSTGSISIREIVLSCHRREGNLLRFQLTIAAFRFSFDISEACTETPRAQQS